MSRISEIRRCKEDLANVRAAIREVEDNGQAIQADGMVYTRATLFRLENRENKLIRRLGRLTGKRRLSNSVRLNSRYSS